MNTFTIWTMHNSRKGTTHITSVKARKQHTAEKKALKECAQDWDEKVHNLVIIGVAEGDVTILEWNDDV